MSTSRRTELSLADRAAIVALKSEGRGWVYISQQVKRVSPNGAQSLYKRTVQRAGSTQLTHLLQHLENAPRPGRPVRFPEESAEAEAEDDEPGMNLWGLRYKVKGPEKDYTSDSAYERA